MRSKLTGFNLVLRALMETGLVAALAYWGYHTGDQTLSKILLALFAPLLVFGFWGAFDFRNVGPNPEIARLLQELLLSGLAAAALYYVGQRSFAFTLALLSIIHHALVYLLGDRLLKNADP